MGLFDNFSFDAGSLISSLVGTLATVYTTKKVYEAQKDASELQSEAAQQQVKSAGFQEQAAASQEMAAVESQRLAELNAIDAEMQSAREVENLRSSQAAEQSESRARAAASGVTLTGSTGEYLDEQARVAGEQLGWMKEAGTRNVEEVRAQGATQYQTAQAQASQTRAGAASTRAQAKGTEAQAEGTMAGAYGSLGSGAMSLWNINQNTKWF